MKRLMISGLAAVALLATATTMLRSHSLATEPPVASLLLGPRASVDVNKLVTEDFEDMSLVYSTATKR